MSKVLIVSANVTVRPYSVYPVGMAYIAGALQAAGHEVRQWDYLVSGQSDQALRDVAESFSPDVICVSLRNVDDVDSTREIDESWSLFSGKHVIEILRGVTDAPIVAGGPALSIMPDRVLQYTGADCGVVGAGDAVIGWLVEQLAEGEKVERIVIGPDASDGSNGFAAPAHDPELIKYYIEASGIVGVQTKRGCVYRCSYCTYPLLEGRKFRLREAREVVDEIEQLGRDHDATSFFFTDSLFNDAAGNNLHVVEEIVRRGLDIRWSAYFSPLGLDAEAIKLCKRSGLYAAELGTDASTDATLAGLDKPFTWTDVEAANKVLIENEIACAHFIMFGGPDETPQTVAAGLANIEGLDQCVVFGFSGIRLYPNSPLAARAIDEGVIVKGDDLFMPVYYVSPEVDKDWLDETLTSSWASKPDRFFPPNKSDRITQQLRGLGWKGLLWDQILIRAGTSKRGGK